MQVKPEELKPAACGLVALVGDAPHTWILVNALIRRVGPFPILVEDGEPEGTFWARRRKLVGGWTAFGQKLARVPQQIAKPGAKRRLAELYALDGVDPYPPEGVPRARVSSVNAAETIEALNALAPRAVFVSSTRMISSRTLDSIAAPFVNYHSGINPAYRGMYGGYHAMAERDAANFGVTLHLVDRGVDTGDVLALHRIKPGATDSFHTYVPLMAVESREVACETMERVLAGDLTKVTSDLPSRQWFGPTAWGYLWTGLTRGVW